MIRYLLPFLLCLCFVGRGQNPVSRHYTVDDGLPSNEVYDVFEDSLGYIWFATDHGISRFNGYEFRNYSTNDGLSHNTIFGFFEDVRHRVWMRAFNSTLCYMENGKIHLYRHNEVLKKFLGRNFIQSFGFDLAGNLWFNSIKFPYGLYRQDHASGNIQKMVQPKGFNAYIRELGGNKFLSGIDLSEGALALNDNVNYTQNTWYYNTALPALEVDRSVFRTSCMNKNHYMVSYGSMGTELKEGRVVKRLVMGHRQTITSIYPEAAKGFWLTGQGLYLSAPDTLLHFFKDWSFNCVRKDRRGGYWLACSDKGVLYVPDISLTIYEQPNPGGIYLLALNNNYMYAVTKTGQLECIPMSEAGPGQVKQTIWLYSWVHDLQVNSDKTRLFVGARQYPLDSESKVAKPLKGPSSIRRASPIFGSCRSAFNSGKYLYMSGSIGWAIVDEKKDTALFSYQHGFIKFCASMCRDSSGRIWIGSTDGLYTFRQWRTEAYRHTEESYRQNISMIKCRGDGLVVASTRGGGLIVIDKDRHYTIRAADGLSTDLCGRFIIDDSLLWVCTNNGLNRIVIRRKQGALQFGITRIQTGHGLPSNLIYDVVRYKDLLILATGKGLAWFNVRSFSLSSYTPLVYIDAVAANRRPVTNDSLLAYNETNLSFGFTGLLYNNSGKLSYRYRLEGYESDWHYTNERSVRYYNLPAGSYTFIVAAMNENGIWSSRPAKYVFAIAQHFSATWWFRSLAVLLFAAAVFFSARYYFGQRRLQESLKANMLLAELKTLRSQMKPHFVFNSLSSIQHFILESDQESAHLYLSRFSSLMRKILENTQKDSISLQQELEMLELYLSLEKLRFGKEFDYTVAVDPSIQRDLCEVPPMLIQPYIENAIWHGLLPKKHDAQLWLRFYVEQETHLVCEVEDNGIGRKASASRQGSRHQSTGLKNMEERIGILNQMRNSLIRVDVLDVYDPDGNASGTKIVLKFQNALTH